MCELLGVSANVAISSRKVFSALAERGGNSGPHKDGWGVTFYEGEQGRGCRTFKDTDPCCCSKTSEFVKQQPFPSQLVLAHIRDANRGSVSMENTHPFTRELWGRCWNYAHNGQLDEFEQLDTGDYHPLGQTDSEQAFCWLLNQMKTTFVTPPSDTLELMEFAATKAAYLSTLGVFNMLLSDGEYLLAFCATKLSWVTRTAPFASVEFTDGVGSQNLAAEYQEQDVISLVATQPLTDEPWCQLQKNDYAIFHGGRCIRCSAQNSTAHHLQRGIKQDV